MPELNTSLMEYNNYVEQIPVDDYSKIAMAKKATFDDNLQKIQSDQSNAASLDINRPIDKEYYGKLTNMLSQNISKFSGADLSNQSIVNTIRGNIGQIIKDPIIQDAVYSSANNKNQMVEREKFEKEGKTNEVNDYIYNRDYSTYLNSTDKGRRFTGQYVPYTDMAKRIMEIGKSAGISEQDIEQMYQTDENGHVLYDNSNHAKWNPIMVEKITKGDSGKLLNFISNALTPADKNQLRMNGIFTYKDYSPQQLLQIHQQDSEEHKSFYNTNILLVSSQLALEQKKNNPNKTIVDQLTAKLNGLNEGLNTINKSDQSIQNTINSLSSMKKEDSTYALDGLKSSIYSNNYLTSMAKGMVDESVKIKNSINPLWTITMEQNRYNLEAKGLDLRNREYLLNKSDKEFNHTLKIKEFEAKHPGLSLDGGGNIIVNAGVVVPSTPDAYLNNREVLLDNNTKQRNDAYLKLGMYFLSQGNPNRSEEDLIAGVKKTMPKDSKETVEQFIIRQGMYQYQQFTKSNNTPQTQQDVMKNLTELNRSIANTTDMLKNSEDYAIKRLQNQTGKTVPSTAELESKIKPVTIQLKENEDPIIIPKNDMLKFGYLAFMGADSKVKDRYKNQLIQKYGEEGFNNLFPYLVGHSLQGGPVEVSPYVKDYVNGLTENYVKLRDYKAEYIKSKDITFQSKDIGLMRGDEKEDDFLSRIGTVIQMYNVNSQPGFNKEDYIKTLLGKGVKIAKIHYEPEGGVMKQTLIITDNSGKEHPLDIDADAAKKLSQVDIQMPKTNFVEDRLMASTTSSTNLSNVMGNKTPWETAYLEKSNFTGMASDKGEIKGDVINLHNGNYSVDFYYKCETCTDFKQYNVHKTVPRENILSALDKITPQYINDIKK